MIHSGSLFQCSMPNSSIIFLPLLLVGTRTTMATLPLETLLHLRAGLLRMPSSTRAPPLSAGTSFSLFSPFIVVFCCCLVCPYSMRTTYPTTFIVCFVFLQHGRRQKLFAGVLIAWYSVDDEDSRLSRFWTYSILFICTIYLCTIFLHDANNFAVTCLCFGILLATPLPAKTM